MISFPVPEDVLETHERLRHDGFTSHLMQGN